MENSRSKHVVGRVLVESSNCGIKVIDYILMVFVICTVAGNVESRRASRMLGKLLRTLFRVFTYFRCDHILHVPRGIHLDYLG